MVGEVNDMATSYCPSCGTPNSVGASFCQRCGRPLVVGAPMGVPPPTGPPLPGTPGAYAPSWAVQREAPLDPAIDLRAISQMEWFAILAITGALLSYIVNFGIGPFYHYSVFGLSSTSPGVASGLALAGLGALSLLGAAITAAAIYFARQSYVELRGHDSRFSTPATLAALAIVGIVVLLIALGVLLSAVSALLNCAGSTSPPPVSCVNLGALLGGLALVLIGAVLAIIGFIGTAIGIWRLGNRYDESLLRAGAVLWFFPFINLIGVILILVGLRSARNRLRGTPPAAVWPNPGS